MNKQLNISHTVMAVLGGVLLLTAAGQGLERELAAVPEADLQKITEAAPAAAPAKPETPRKILVFCRCEGFFHGSIPWCNAALEIMGKKTGAYSIDVADRMSVFTPENLKQYDAIVFNNTTGLKFEDASQKEALMQFVKNGKGIIGIHAATDNFNTWPEAAAMMGGMFDGHPWGGGGTWAVKIDEPKHPLNASFDGKGFLIRDEIYQLKEPYTRDDLWVLLSLDMTNECNAQPGQKRADKDNVIAWIRPFGKGRVFYSSLGHNNEILWNPAVLGQYLAGIQYALGDLKVDDMPSAKLKNTPQPARTTDKGGVDDQISVLAAYTYESDRTAYSQIDTRIRQGSPEENRIIEKQLLEILAMPDATVDARREVCRLLRRVGTEQSVAPLAAMLDKPELSHMACYALQGISSPAVDSVLLAAQETAGDELKPGIISSLGVRKTEAAVRPLIPYISSAKRETAVAAINALGRIGTQPAARVLQSGKVAEGLETLRQNSLLLCADTLAVSGKQKIGMELYRELASKGADNQIRMAAIRGEVMHGKAKGVPIILRLLNATEPEMRTAAAGLIIAVPGPQATTALAEALKGATPEQQVLLI